MAELRSERIQTDSMRFRKNMERTGELLAYELSKSLEYRIHKIRTPLGIARVSLMEAYPYLITIMRAGIPFYQGFLNYFDKSDSGFIGAFRTDYDQNKDFDIDLDYLAVGEIDDREVVLIDPMLATGRSIFKAINSLLQKGIPQRIHVAALIASRRGYEYLNSQCEVPLSFWIAAMDDDLNDKSYIIPGLGDAGDLSFGKKA